MGKPKGVGIPNSTSLQEPEAFAAQSHDPSKKEGKSQPHRKKDSPQFENASTKHAVRPRREILPPKSRYSLRIRTPYRHPHLPNPPHRPQRGRSSAADKHGKANRPQIRATSHPKLGAYGNQLPQNRPACGDGDRESARARRRRPNARRASRGIEGTDARDKRSMSGPTGPWGGKGEGRRGGSNGSPRRTRRRRCRRSSCGRRARSPAWQARPRASKAPPPPPEQTNPSRREGPLQWRGGRGASRGPGVAGDRRWRRRRWLGGGLVPISPSEGGGGGRFWALPVTVVASCVISGGVAGGRGRKSVGARFGTA
jgi:hypothetical protein